MSRTREAKITQDKLLVLEAASLKDFAQGSQKSTLVVYTFSFCSRIRQAHHKWIRQDFGVSAVPEPAEWSYLTLSLSTSSR